MAGLGRESTHTSEEQTMANAKKVPQGEMTERQEIERLQKMIMDVAGSISGRILTMLTEEMRTHRENGTWDDAGVARVWAFGSMDGLIYALAVHMTVHICKRTNTLTSRDPGFHRMLERIQSGLREVFFATLVEASESNRAPGTTQPPSDDRSDQA